MNKLIFALICLSFMAQTVLAQDKSHRLVLEYEGEVRLFGALSAASVTFESDSKNYAAGAVFGASYNPWDFGEVDVGISTLVLPSSQAPHNWLASYFVAYRFYLDVIQWIPSAGLAVWFTLSGQKAESLGVTYGPDFCLRYRYSRKHAISACTSVLTKALGSEPASTFLFSIRFDAYLPSSLGLSTLSISPYSTASSGPR